MRTRRLRPQPRQDWRPRRMKHQPSDQAAHDHHPHLTVILAVKAFSGRSSYASVPAPPEPKLAAVFPMFQAASVSPNRDEYRNVWNTCTPPVNDRAPADDDAARQAKRHSQTAPAPVPVAQMALAVRTLPIHLDPMEGEALDSWLEAICRQMGCAWGDFIEAVGLPPPSRGIRTPTWLIRLSPKGARALHAATGTPIHTLHSMTLASLDGTALGLLPATPALDRSFPWSRFRFSRYCPDCLQQYNGGRWQLFWRSGWAFACTEHCCLLVDECLACMHRHRGHVGHAELVPHGQRCSNPEAHATARAPERCGADLAANPTVRLGQGHPTIAAQHLIQAATVGSLPSTCPPQRLARP